MSTTENIKYLIDAEDRASAKLRGVGQSLETNVKKVKELGGRAKASTELVGTLANALGGTQFGAAAGQIAQVTERVSAFSEVAKTGGAGALAFKAGLVAAVGVAAFNIGKMIGDWAFQTEKWKQELQSAREEMQRLADMRNQAMADRGSKELEEISLIADPAEQKAKIDETLAFLENEISTTAGSIRRKRADIAGMEEHYWRSGNFQAEIDTEKQLVSEQEKKLELLKQQKKAIDDQYSSEAQRLELLRQEKREREQGEAYLDRLQEEYERLLMNSEELARYEAEKNTGTQEQADAAMRLNSEIERLKAAEADKLRIAQEKQKLEEDEIKRQTDLAKLYSDQVASLEMQAVKLLEGDKAARVMQLTMQGMSEEQANQIANLEEQLDALGEKEKESAKLGATNNAASESRLLAGRANIAADPALTEAKKANELAAKRQETLQELLKEIRAVKDNTAGGLEVETVG